MKEEGIELKVCPGCDAPLPCNPTEISYFNICNILCDDCYNLKEIEKKNK